MCVCVLLVTEPRALHILDKPSRDDKPHPSLVVLKMNISSNMPGGFVKEEKVVK